MIGLIVIAVGLVVFLVGTGMVAIPKEVVRRNRPRKNGAVWDGVERRRDTTWREFQEYSKRIREEGRAHVS